MDREIAAEFYGNSQPRHAFSNTNRHQVTSLATHLSQRFNLSIQGLIFDSTIPVDQCREALAAINTSWEPIPNVSAQNGKSMRAYMLRINHTRPKQIFVAVSDFSHNLYSQEQGSVWRQAICKHRRHHRPHRLILRRFWNNARTIHRVSFFQETAQIYKQEINTPNNSCKHCCKAMKQTLNKVDMIEYMWYTRDCYLRSAYNSMVGAAAR